MSKHTDGVKYCSNCDTYYATNGDKCRCDYFYHTIIDSNGELRFFRTRESWAELCDKDVYIFKLSSPIAFDSDHWEYPKKDNVHG